MSEFRQEVRTFKVDMTCDECNEGQMRPTGMVLTSHPPSYVHRCTKCDAQKNYDKTYPHYACEVK